MPSSRVSDIPSSGSSSLSSWDTTLALVDVFGRAPEEFGVASPTHSTPTFAQTHPWSSPLSSPMSPGQSGNSNGSSATSSGEPSAVAASGAAATSGPAPWEDDVSAADALRTRLRVYRILTSSLSPVASPALPSCRCAARAARARCSSRPTTPWSSTSARRRARRKAHARACDGKQLERAAGWCCVLLPLSVLLPSLLVLRLSLRPSSVRAHQSSVHSSNLVIPVLLYIWLLLQCSFLLQLPCAPA